MRMRTKSACVVLAWSIILTLTAAGLTQSARPAQANTRTASSTQAITLTTTPAAAPFSAAFTAPFTAPSTAAFAAPFAAAASPAAKTARPAVRSAPKTTRYAVRPGDTLSAIAARSGLPGGWQALYTANRTVIGSDPDLIRPGTMLTIPRPADPARYQVTAGDTLTAIAARSGLPGGWQALYTANRKAIGSDPDLIRPGTVLTLPHRAPAPPATHPGKHPHQPPPPAHTRHQQPPPAHAGHQPPPVPAKAPAPPGMPAWLTATLLAAGLIGGGAFLLQLAMMIGRRRTRTAVRSAPAPAAAGREQAFPSPAADRARTAADKACTAADRTRIIVTDYHRLIVTHSPPDPTVYVLRPPGADPKAIMRVARLVLAESPYRDLAEHLGLPASWPIILADYDRLVVTHSRADDTVYVLRPPGEDPKAVLRAARLVLQEEPYEELASHLGVPASWPLE